MITDHLPAPRAILFDLDGTLADTAPDLAAAINLLRARAGLAPTPYDILRPTASAGARGMIGASYGIQPGESGYEALKDGFLNNYEAALAVESRLFDGIPALLEGLQALGLAWGVVTNKAARFTDPLVGQIGLGAAGCVISGDTMAHPKPHPAPCWKRRAAWSWRRKTAGTWATTCATSRPAVPPACARSPAPGATAAPSSRSTGTPTICWIRRKRCSSWSAPW